MKTTEAKIYLSRRRELANLMGPDGIAVIATNKKVTRTNDVHFPFRPNSDFFYLTGFDEPDAIATLETDANGEMTYCLFCNEKNEAEEIWNGLRLGPDGALCDLAADEAFTLDAFGDELAKRMDGKKTVFYRFGHKKRLGNHINQLMRNGGRGAKTVMPRDLHNLSHHLHEMRLIKSAPELKLIRKACSLSAKAHNAAMQFAKPNMYEYEVAALIEYYFTKAGGQAGFETIVGSGANACVLHYTTNRNKIAADVLVLCDAGAELNAYNGDISRTWPSSGTFEGEQRAIYELVLAAQSAAIQNVQPGQAQDEHHEAAVTTLTQGLIDLGIIRDSFDAAIEKKTYQHFFMHRTGHWLGADVHDVGDYKVNQKWRELEAGMVLTVEPGLYIRPLEDVDARWHNIGVRIEDNLVVTHNGHENLTTESPKEMDEIEALRRAAF